MLCGSPPPPRMFQVLFRISGLNRLINTPDLADSSFSPIETQIYEVEFSALEAIK